MASTASSPPSGWQPLPLGRVLVCGALIVTLSMGVRHGFGLWLGPVTQEYGWSREHFAFALALQNLVWGASQPVFGALADRFGAFRVAVLGALLYAAGVATMSVAATPALFALVAGVLLGLAQSCTTYSVIYGVIGRNADAAQRSSAMGIVAAAGSFGQFLMLPLERELLAAFGWQSALLILGGMMLAIIPAAVGLRERGRPLAAGGPSQSVLQALREAAGYRSFQLLMAGYFVCGFQVVFIGVHLPSYLRDKGLGGEVAAWSLALIGLFNVFGSYAAGQLGQRLYKRHILAFIYAARSLAIGLFLLAPISPLSVYLFAAAMGLLWLSTIPPTNAVVAQMFGPRHFGMLSGFVFFSHQVGSFLGVWLGGRLFDLSGSYDLVWGLCIVLGIAAALVNLPIDEGAAPRLKAQSA
jgi:MFS family permease